VLAADLPPAAGRRFHYSIMGDRTFFLAATPIDACFDQGTPMSQNVYLRIMADGRFFGLNSGDWMILLGGFAMVALVVLLL